MNPVHHSINYIEFPSTDLASTKKFYGDVFGWEFQDWGETYISFSGAEVSGGFELNPEGRSPSRQGALVVLYSKDLVATEKAIVAAGGKVVTEAFDFPGGRRFQFTDPNGNELAVWTEPAK